MSLTAIDLSRLPAPDAIESLDYETLLATIMADFRSRYPDYSALLESDPAFKILEVAAYQELLVRNRVNEGVRAVLAPLAKGSDLDNVAARANVARLDGESDARLLLRYLMAFDRASAGSADRYLYEAYTAWPSLHHAAVVGRTVHGRAGDVDIVVAGPEGRTPTSEELTLVRSAVTASGVKPEATRVTVLAAKRVLYSATLTIIVPSGPDSSVVQAEAVARVKAAADERRLVGAEVPVVAITGAAYGPSVLRVEATAPAADIPPDPYSIPILSGVQIATEVG